MAVFCNQCGKRRLYPHKRATCSKVRGRTCLRAPVATEMGRHTQSARACLWYFCTQTHLDHDYWQPWWRGCIRAKQYRYCTTWCFPNWLGRTGLAGGICRYNAQYDDGALRRDVVVLLDFLQVQSRISSGCSIGGYVLIELVVARRSRVFVCSKANCSGEPKCK